MSISAEVAWPAAAGNWLKELQRRRSGNIVLLFVVLQVVAIAFALVFPDEFRYVSTGNVQLMLKAIPSLVIVVLGVNLLMIAGEFDLTVGATFTLSALVMAKRGFRFIVAGNDLTTLRAATAAQRKLLKE